MTNTNHEERLRKAREDAADTARKVKDAWRRDKSTSTDEPKPAPRTDERVSRFGGGGRLDSRGNQTNG